MEKAKINKRGWLIVLGIGLMLGLLVIPLLAGGIVYEFPRDYFSKSTVEMVHDVPGNPTGYDPATFPHEVQAAMAPFGAAAEYKQIRQTDFYELGIWDRDPGEAARKANEAAASLKGNGSFHVKIWESAEPALGPGRPKVIWYILPAIAMGFLSLGAGGIVLIVTLVSSRSGPKAVLQT